MADTKNNRLNKNGSATPENKPKREKGFIVAIIVCAAITLGVLIGALVMIIGGAGKEVDYLSDKLSKYIELSREDYTDIPVDIPLLEYNEGLIAREVRRLLVKNKNKDPEYKGASITSLPITLGDVVNLRYRGFFVDENGKETEIPAASNFSDDEPHALEVGSGSFIEGIEEALIGIVPDSVPSFNKITSGRVVGTNVIYVSYNAYKSDGSVDIKKLERIDLNDPDVDKIYGSGFKRSVVTAEIGKEFSKEMIFRIPGDDIDTVYHDFIIEFATDCESAPLSVEVTFPANYSVAELRGKKAVFELYPSSAIIYKVGEWGDAFIRDTLKADEGELSEYEGATLAEKYENRLEAELKKSIEDANRELLEEFLWAHLNEKTEFKKLPEKTVKRVYMEYYSDIATQYEYYSAYYDSIDKFAVTYLGLSSGADWRAYITGQAENVVKEKLIFYYIVREESFLPAKDEFDKMYSDVIDEYMEYYKELYEEDFKKCETEEEKAELLEKIKKEMLEYYGEEYFEEIVYYDFAMDKIISLAVK